MTVLTPEQQDIVDAPMVPLCVIACAGSGKTKTAVHRLVQIRRNLGEARGRVALLSFSNVAVETFSKAYDRLASSLPSSVGRSRVDIDTLDAFITTNIIRPHGHRTMNSTQGAFLVNGGAAFLEGFKFPTSSFPQSINKLQLVLKNGAEVFFYIYKDKVELVDTSLARNLIERLGRTGAYTHDLGRYWVYRILKERPELLKAMARRYPQIVIDEAQDIGSVHQAILELLISAGSCVTLIGDPNQGIYEFAGADGMFLSDYHQRAGVMQYSLKRNFRSNPRIVDLANDLCGRADIAERSKPSTPHGAFFTSYIRNQHAHLIAAFHGAIIATGADIKHSAVLCRARSLAEMLRGEAPAGQGLVKIFAAAAVLRDQQKDFLGAFQRVAVALVALMDNAPLSLVNQITQPSSNPDDKELRKAVWAFTRDADSGLPSSSLVANVQWHPLLLARVKLLLSNLETNFGLMQAKNIGRKLSTRELPNTPLASAEGLADSDATTLRIDTVHKAKGESLDAILYMANKEHAQAMLEGVTSEIGRIGYVAATRARDLLWVAVPRSALDELRPKLLAKGFEEIGIVAATPNTSKAG